MSMPEAKTVTETLIASMETVAVLAVGDYNEVRFTAEEKASITEPLARTIQRMSPAAIGRYQALTDPVTVLVVAGMWAARVYGVYHYQQQERKEAANGRTNGDYRNNGSSSYANGNGSGASVGTASSVTGVGDNSDDPDDRATGNTGGLPGFSRKSHLG